MKIPQFCLIFEKCVDFAKICNTDSKSAGEICVGSSPTPGTKLEKSLDLSIEAFFILFFFGFTFRYFSLRCWHFDNAAAFLKLVSLFQGTIFLQTDFTHFLSPILKFAYHAKLIIH